MKQIKTLILLLLVFAFSSCVKDPEVPIREFVIETTVTNITRNSAKCNCNIPDIIGALPVTARGVCWITSQNPTIENNHTTDSSGTGVFTSSITGLTINTTYYVRAYATNSKGTFYGEEKSFKTQNGIAIVTTNTVGNITATTATCGGNVTSDGGFPVTARGVCWSTSANPTIANSHTTNGSGTGTFTSSITGLTKSTTYYVRSYATNSQVTSYGETKIFTTTGGESLPTVTTDDISHITHYSAISGGNVTSSGVSSVTSKGVCWSTSQNPTIASSHTTNGSGTGSFLSSIRGLTVNTTYYVRAYATNSNGTAYGTQKLFTTTSSCSLFHENYITETIPTWSDNNGYVSGTNNHQFTSVAEYFTNSGTKYVKEIHMDYIIEGSNGYVTFKIYSNNNGYPGTVLYSYQCPMSNLYSYASYNSTSGYYVGGVIIYNFSQAVSGNFFVGVDITNAQSGFAVFTSAANTYTNTGFVYRSTYSSWYAYPDIITQGSAYSLAIRPVVCQNDGKSSGGVMIRKGEAVHQVTIKKTGIILKNK